MSTERKPVNSTLPEAIIKRWHLFAIEEGLKKGVALEKLVMKGLERAKGDAKGSK